MIFDRSKLPRRLRSEKGVALLLALSFITLMLFIAVEVNFDSQVEYRVSLTEFEKLKASSLAKAGAELSVFRIYLFNQVMSQVGNSLGPQSRLLDLIWQFPFVWPPMVPDELNQADKDIIKTSVADSLFDGQYVTTITGESSKIDINDLASPSEVLQKATQGQILEMLLSRQRNDPEFMERTSDVDLQRLMNNIADWADTDSESRNGGAESAIYPDSEGKLPPNRPFASLKELHMVVGMTDVIYELLEPELTVFGLKGININRASKNVLRSLDSQIDDRMADSIIQWRDDETTPGRGPFSDEKQFIAALTQLGMNVGKFNVQGIPLYFGSERIFRVKSTGQVGKSSREIVAIVYDFDTVKARLKNMTTTTTTTTFPATQRPGTTVSSTTTTTTTMTMRKGRPFVVEWIEE